MSECVCVRDRDREVWLPLFIVAHLADSEWIKRAELALSNIEEAKSDNTLPRERQLLADIWKIFQSQRCTATLKKSPLQNED